MEQWRIELCRGANGICYAEKDLLEELETKDPITLERLVKTRKKFVLYHTDSLKRSGKLEKIDEYLYELKFALGKIHIRYFGFFDRTSSPPIFHVLLAFRKKTNKIPNQVLQTLRDRYNKYKKQK